MQSILQIINYHLLNMIDGEDLKEDNMYIDVFELVPDNDRPRKDCYDCLNCSHLVAVSVDSTHHASTECDIDNEDIEL